MFQRSWFALSFKNYGCHRAITAVLDKVTPLKTYTESLYSLENKFDTSSVFGPAGGSEHSLGDPVYEF